MPRKNQPGCPCCAASTKICVTACGSLKLVGATVTLRATSTGPVLYSGTTDAAGCVPFATSGSYYVAITYGSSTVYQGTPTLPAGGTTSISVGSANLVCCGGYVIPTTLTLTDPDGSLAFLYDPTSSPPTWYGGHAVQRTSCTTSTPNRVCVVAAPSTGPVRICYQMTCNAGQVPTFTVQRSWSWVYEPGSPTSIWFQDPTGFSPGQFCITAPPPICGNPLTDTAGLSANPTSTSPFALSGTPAPAPSNATGDPVGGSVAISA